MRCSRLVGVSVALLLQALLAHGADVIASFTAPAVSYQFPEDFAGQALTNGGIVSPFASYQFPDDYGAQVLVNGGYISPFTSYQYFEWPGGGILGMRSGSPLSYFYQFSSSSGAILVHGRVTDVNGLPLSGARVSAMVMRTLTAQGTTDANGSYLIPSVTPGVYDLWATEPTHQTSIRALTLNATTADQDFQLKLLPATPATVQVNRSAILTPILGPLGSSLKVYDGTGFVSVGNGTTLSPSAMTIVLTHGWIVPLPLGPAGIDGWPTTIAKGLRSNGITPGIANIVVWDWRTAATGIAPPQLLTPGQGTALGENLLAVLGANYSHPVHFIGHSLGTMVNATAVNFLHGDRIPSTEAPVSPTPWPTDGEPFIHITLFDEAAETTANTTYSQLIFDGNTVSQIQSPTLLSSENTTTLNGSPPLPLHFTWADNYVAEVGFYHANAVNALLPYGLLKEDPVSAHGYPAQWYEESIEKPLDPLDPLGFQFSFENDLKQVAPFSNIPPSGLSGAYIQVFALDQFGDQLALLPVPFGQGPSVVSMFGITADVLVKAINGTAQFVGTAKADILDVAQWPSQSISQGFTYVNNIAEQDGQAVLNLLDSSLLHVTLTTTPPTSNSKTGWPIGPHPLGLGDNLTNTSPMIWLPIQFPSSSTGMAFDFRVSGDTVDDSLVCGIGTNSLVSLQVKYIPTNVVSSSSLLDVSAWMGSTNELFFGFLGGSSTNATLEISNIRFFSLLPPNLSVQATNGHAELSWPAWAGGYVLESTAALSSNSWLLLTNAPTIVNDRYSIEADTLGNLRFYRLKQR